MEAAAQSSYDFSNGTISISIGTTVVVSYPKRGGLAAAEATHVADSFTITDDILYIYSNGQQVAAYREWDNVEIKRADAPFRLDPAPLFPNPSTNPWPGHPVWPGPTWPGTPFTYTTGTDTNKEGETSWQIQ